MPPIESDEARSRVRDPQRTAESFYGALSAQGYTPQQVIALANVLLGMVAEDILERPPLSAK